LSKSRLSTSFAQPTIFGHGGKGPSMIPKVSFCLFFLIYGFLSLMVIDCLKFSGTGVDKQVNSDDLIKLRNSWFYYI
jgi:hypothetical protein